MRVHVGKEKLGTWENLTLMIDWDDFTYFKGGLFNRERLDKALGNVFVGLAVMLWVISVVFVFLSAGLGRINFLNPKTILELLPWIGGLLWVYSMYLKRNKAKFNFNREQVTMAQIRKKLNSNREAITEVDNLFSYSLYSSFDHLYTHKPDTFILGLVEITFMNPVCSKLWERLGVDKNTAAAAVQNLVKTTPLDFDSNYTWLFPGMLEQSWYLENEKIDELSLFFALYTEKYLSALLQLGVQAAELQAVALWVRNENRKQRYHKIWEKMALLKPKGVVNKAYTSRYAATLEMYAEDYTKQAANGKFVITLGKEQAMSEILKILQKQNNAAGIIIGDPGVGKSQFLKHLAVRMVVEDVPKQLQDKRLVVFNFNKAFTENQTLENFKVTLEKMLSEVAAAKNIILVLEDMDQLLNVRADLQAEIVNLLVSAIDKNNLRLVGTTSVDGYNRFIKPVRNLSSLFQPIQITEPDPLISLQILIDQTGKYESQYGIKIQVDALRQIVALAPKYAYERVMPDKAIDLLEEALLEARERGLSFLSSDVVSGVVSRKVGVTVGELSKSESEILMKLEDTMHKRIVGQQVAIKAIASALRRARAGLVQGKKPLASFLFFGPTGVGKTEVAKTLAQTYYGDEKMMIRIDMSEYHEEKNLERLIGYTEGSKFINGFLTEAVRSRPFSLLLLDEIEKANPKVMDLFLQVLDEGSLTDGAGRKVDFSNTIIISTSNAGSREIAELIGEGMKYEAVYTRVLPSLKQIFRVEFLNRFDKIIMFKPLLPVEVGEIAVRMLDQVNENLLMKGMSLKYSHKVIEDLVRVGYDPIYGAREIRRVIQEKVEDMIAEKVVMGELVSGKTINFITLDNVEVK